MSISDFFKNTLGANLSNARWSWGASNPNTNQLFLRVWDDDLETVDGVTRISILGTDWGETSAGFPERKRHVEALRGGAEGYGVLCTAKDIHSPGGTGTINGNLGLGGTLDMRIGATLLNPGPESLVGNNRDQVS